MQMMLNEQELRAFFVKHNAHPGTALGIPYYEFKQIVIDSSQKDRSFGLFVYRSFDRPEHSSRYYINFNSWSELVSCYQHFMTGFSQNKC